jgi:hypothetical protein
MRTFRHLWDSSPPSTGRSPRSVPLDPGPRTYRNELARRIVSAAMGFATGITAQRFGHVTNGTASDVMARNVKRRRDGVRASASTDVAGLVCRMTIASRSSTTVLPYAAPPGTGPVFKGVESFLTNPLTSHPGGFRPTQASIHDDAAESDALGTRPFERRRGATRRRRARTSAAGRVSRQRAHGRAARERDRRSGRTRTRARTRARVRAPARRLAKAARSAGRTGC